MTNLDLLIFALRTRHGYKSVPSQRPAAVVQPKLRELFEAE